MKEVVKEVVFEANVGDPIVSGVAQKIKLGLISSPQFESEFELKFNFNFLSKFESKFESKFLPSKGKKVEE